MKLILCLDDRNGMSFYGRRQSSDRTVISRILELVADAPLWMNGYSAKLFPPEARTFVSEDFLERADAQTWCFVETTDVMPYLADADTLVIFRWNRTYPGSLHFPERALQDGWQQVSTQDFPGHSHERITQEVYTR